MPRRRFGASISLECDSQKSWNRSVTRNYFVKDTPEITALKERIKDLRNIVHHAKIEENKAHRRIYTIRNRIAIKLAREEGQTGVST
jgi:hypothetical protein